MTVTKGARGAGARRAAFTEADVEDGAVREGVQADGAARHVVCGNVWWVRA